jgi:signal peptidase I
MEPQIKNNTLIIVNKYIYGPKFPFTEKRIFDATRSIKRGDVVLVMSQEYYKTNVLYRALSKLINTLTFTLIDIPSMMENKEESIYIKRVIGIPGDKIRFKYINGKVEVFINDILEKYAIDKKYITIDDDDRYPLISEIKMNKDEYFIMGDNRKESSDSRIWGAVKSNQIIGKAILIYHPYLGVIK